MKTLHLFIIISSLVLVLILPQAVFGHVMYDFSDDLKPFDKNSAHITGLVHDGAILITNQTMKKTEYKMGEKILIHSILTNIGDKSISISYLWHPFFSVISFQNGTVVWVDGPAVPVLEYSSNLSQTLKPHVSFTGGINDIADPRYPPALYAPGNYSISSAADFYVTGNATRNFVWSEPTKFAVLPEKYSVADMNMLSPLRQFLEGISATSVNCADGLELLIKTHTGLPVCIKHNSVTKLIERGWAIKAPSPVNVVMPSGFDDPYSGKTFEPSSIKVVIGINNTVHWKNNSLSAETILSDGFKESNSFGEIFGGSTLMPGDTYEFTFTNSGTFGYHGQVNSWNHGKVIVLPS